MSSWFGFGGSRQEAPVQTQQQAQDLTSQAFPSSGSSSTSSTSSASPNAPMTVSDMFADLQSVESVKQKVAPMPQDEVELLYLADNPFGMPGTAPPTGTFGPLPMRTNYDKLLYGVGTAYLGGLTFGGGYGALRGFRTAQVPNMKVRMNNVLNQTTRYGPWAANSMGILTMGWALLDSAFEAIRGGQSDYFNHVGAAFTSGLLFKSTAGLRPAVMTGAILSGVVGAYGVYEKATEDGVKMPVFGGAQSAKA
ncbi:Mitochondrial import inner membrane translocase subunit tim23 [Thoreauomyces humboldtii]|nr:Mitochondrial import inner membrane translocase subunit tim23 [Thoreauomyces humboldtii]